MVETEGKRKPFDFLSFWGDEELGIKIEVWLYTLHGFPKDAAERYVRERTKLEKEKNEKEDELLKKLEAAKKRANFLKTYDGEWLE